MSSKQVSKKDQHDPTVSRPRIPAEYGNLITNPAVSVHLDSSDDAVILQGEAFLETPDHELAVQLAVPDSRVRLSFGTQTFVINRSQSCYGSA
jgi:hypothetical protein